MADDDPLDWRLHAFRSDLADARLKGRVEAARFAEGAPATVALPSTPLLRRPEAGAPMDSQLLLGETVLVFDRHDGWAWVQADADGYTGYVAEAAVASGLPPATHKVTAGQTIVLSDEKQVAAPLHTLSLGARVAVADEGERFHRLAGGGFIFAAHLAPIDQAEDDWVAVAERLLGLPYLWGGRGHGGIDCSGLVQVALAACGQTPLRDSDQQAHTIGAALPLDPGGWRRGDLLYTKGHVVIVQGPDTVLHATGNRWAVILEKRAEALARLQSLGLPVISARRPGPVER
jgi:cell wall-associated NlpC family hydrolase